MLCPKCNRVIHFSPRRINDDKLVIANKFGGSDASINILNIIKVVPPIPREHTTALAFFITISIALAFKG